MKKFFAIIGNPPYQDGRKQIYASFFQESKKVGDNVDLIFPTGWQSPKVENGLSVLNTPEVKEDRQIVSITNVEDAFPNVSGAKYTNIVLWRKGYDNQLNGKQRIINPDKSEEIVKLAINKTDIQKPSVVDSVCEKVDFFNEPKIIDFVSTSKPYGFRADPLDNPEKYGLVLHDRPYDNAARLFGQYQRRRAFKYIDKDNLPKSSPLFETYKLFVVKAWGNMDEKQGYLGGSYSEIIVAEPYDCCSEMYIEVGPFQTREEAENARKYFYTKFFRTVFYKNKYSQNTAKDTYKYVPIQNFTSSSDIDWSQSIADIDQQLYRKYGLSREEIDFIESHVKEMV